MRRLIVLGSFLFIGLVALALPAPAAAAIRYVATTSLRATRYLAPPARA
jgi:hypothetical protein